MAREPMSPVRRRVLCLAGSVFAFVAALAVLAYAGYWYVPQVFLVQTRPIAEFDEGEVRVISAVQGERAYLLSLVVDSMDDPVPPMEVRVRGLDGAAVEVSAVEGWSRLFGRKFRKVRRLHVEPSGASFEIVADVTDPDAAEGRADFALFGDSDLAVSRYVDWAGPWWIGGSVLLAASLVLLCLAVFWRGGSALGVSLDD